MSAKRVNNAAIELFIFVSALFVLILTATNIESYQSPKQVLAAETQVGTNNGFWEEFLSKNPNYVPGWLEIGRADKAKEIDPNYITP